MDTKSFEKSFDKPNRSTLGMLVGAFRFYFMVKEISAMSEFCCVIKQFNFLNISREIDSKWFGEKKTIQRMCIDQQFTIYVVNDR